MPTYDCSHPLETGMPVYPGTDPASFDVVSTVDADGARVRHLDCTSHAGTHVDAPAHMVADGATLDAFDVADFIFDARLVDCSDADPRDALDTTRLPAPLRDDPTATDADMLVFHTGWDAHWGTDRYRDSPFLAPGLAEWCADAGFDVAIDTFSPDPVPSANPDSAAPDDPDGHPAHAALCGAGRLIVENLRGLDRLPDRVELSAVPLRIAGGDGSPVRAVARVRESLSHPATRPERTR